VFQRKRGASVRQEQGLWLKAWLPRLQFLGAILSLTGVLGAAHGGWQVLRDEAFFPLRHVQVQGEMRNLSAADVQRVVRHFLGESFVDLNIGMLRDTFLLNPWVEQVSIQRRWPDTLEIHLQERAVFGHWGSGEMLDQQGIRFRPAYFRTIHAWPRLFGPDGQEQVLMETFNEAQARVARIDLRIVFLEMDERRAWRMHFDNGVEIKLGREQLLARLQRFVDIYPRVLAQRADSIATVDMRYMNGFAVRWLESDERNTRRAGRGAAGAATRAARVETPRRVEAG
jgi:cell division protein FtsQ